MPPARARASAALVLGLVVVGVVGAYAVRKLDGDDGSKDAVKLPAGWNLCTNTVRRFSIGYPGGWHEGHLSREEACSFIDPKPFRIVQGEFHTALEVHFYEEPAKNYLIGAPGFCRKSVHSVESVSLGGFRAIRMEAVDAAATACGTRIYAYVVNRPSGILVIETTEPGVQGYPRRKQVVDTALRTLSFLPTRHVAGCLVPNVQGLKLSVGLARIAESKCSRGHVRKIRARELGTILWQSPHPGVRRAPAWPVDVYIGGER